MRDRALEIISKLINEHKIDGTEAIVLIRAILNEHEDITSNNSTIQVQSHDSDPIFGPVKSGQLYPGSITTTLPGDIYVRELADKVVPYQTEIIHG